MSEFESNPVQHCCVFRFYAELRDFLPSEDPTLNRSYWFQGNPSVKDAIEAQGVPHTEVGLILADDRPVGFGSQLEPGHRIAVYPDFKTLEVPESAMLRPQLGSDVRFVLDVHLGKLARWLRLCGFDSAYRNDYDDAEVAAIAAKERRVVLTRDRRLLFRREIDHGHWVRSDQPDDQILEVLRHYELGKQIELFRRCLDCNGLIQSVAKSDVIGRLEPLTRKHFHSFRQCMQCGKVFWKGSHYDRMLAKLKRMGMVSFRPEVCGSLSE